jgi:hypothetical protein
MITPDPVVVMGIFLDFYFIFSLRPLTHLCPCILRGEYSGLHFRIQQVNGLLSSSKYYRSINVFLLLMKGKYVRPLLRVPLSCLFSHQKGATKRGGVSFVWTLLGSFVFMLVQCKGRVGKGRGNVEEAEQMADGR